jgi:3-methylcrotonyl-CoA carboxylase alpha subunit
MAERTVRLRRGSRDYTIAIAKDGHVRVDGVAVAASALSDGAVRLDESGVTAWVAAAGDARWVFLDGRTYVFEVQKGRTTRRQTGHHESLTAPMPATVRRINVAVGDRVKRGDTLIVLEAMKMELPVKAAADGVVELINCRESELVQPGTTLIELEAGDGEAS